MKIGIGCDHGGVNHKKTIKEHLISMGYDVIDYGTEANIPADYPDIAQKVCNAFLLNEFDRGILICGTGIGMSIAANKIKGIRAANITDTFSARMCREHNNAQIICLGERITGPSLALELIDAYLKSEFGGERHARRVNKIMALEERE